MNIISTEVVPSITKEAIINTVKFAKNNKVDGSDEIPTEYKKIHNNNIRILIDLCKSINRSGNIAKEPLKFTN